MAKQDDYVRYTIRVPAELYERLQLAAGEKSVNAEIVSRLENSFDEFEGYKEMTELFLATMQDNAANAQRELLEYRQMVGTVRLMRHMIDRFAEHFGSEKLPEDLKTLLSVLVPRSDKAETEDISTILEDVVDAMERHQEMAAADNLAGGGSSLQKVQSDEIRKRLLKLQRKLHQIPSPDLK